MVPRLFIMLGERKNTMNQAVIPYRCQWGTAELVAISVSGSQTADDTGNTVKCSVCSLLCYHK